MALMTWVAFLLLGKPEPGVDDAYIFFRYGKNIANGNGFVYNAGSERVEGFSSVLWQGVVSIAFIFTNRPQFYLQILSLFMVSSSIAILWYFVDEGTAVTSRGILLLVWVFGSPSFVIWTGLTLMDSAIWSSLLILATVITLKPRLTKFLTLLVPLIVVTRPEGMLWGIVFITLLFLLTTSQNGMYLGWQSIKWPFGSYLITLTGLIGWRLLYFGYPLPNTYYAKVSPDILYNLVQGSIYLRKFLMQNPYVALMSLGASVSIIILNFRWIIITITHPPADKVQGKAISIALVSITGLLIPVWTGGDHFSLYRFYQSIWPILLLPTFALIDIQENQVSRNLRYGLLTVAVLLFVFLPRVNWTRRDLINNFALEFKYAQSGQQIGEQLNKTFPQHQPSIGAIVVGGVGYTYEGPVIDVMGLNNVQMAHTAGLRYGYKNHAAFNQEIFYKQNPQLFLPEIAPDTITAVSGCHQLSDRPMIWPNSALNGMLSEKRFWQQYVRGIISHDGQNLLAYIDKDYLNTMIENRFAVTVLDCAP